MAHKKKGQLTTSGEWAKHLRQYSKRQFWKGERKAEKKLFGNNLEIRSSDKAKELSLKIEFLHGLSEKEQKSLWGLLVGKIESLDLSAGGGHDSICLNWILDCSVSSLKKHEIIDEISEFLLNIGNQVTNFEIK